MAAPAFADGDPAAGEKAFNKCKSCHMIETPDGETIVRGGRVGPNLYGIPGRQAGTVEGFNYGKSIIEAGEKGLVWDAETFAAYSADPKGYMQEYLGESSVQVKMSFRLRDGAEDIYAYLESVSAE